jgi:hypothetical protein
VAQSSLVGDGKYHGGSKTLAWGRGKAKTDDVMMHTKVREMDEVDKQQGDGARCDDALLGMRLDRRVQSQGDEVRIEAKCADGSQSNLLRGTLVDSHS